MLATRIAGLDRGRRRLFDLVSSGRGKDDEGGVATSAQPEGPGSLLMASGTGYCPLNMMPGLAPFLAVGY